MIKKIRLEKVKKELRKYPLFELLGKGKRGIVYKISESLVVKIERDDINAVNPLKKEYEILKRIGKHSYFPKVLEYNEELRYLIREFARGISIESVVVGKDLIKKCLKMCYVLDKEGVNQAELTNPFKHIYVNNDEVMMIDFERASLTQNPKNVSQFTQYLVKRLKINNKNLILLVQEYKKDYSRKKFNKILTFFQA